MNTAGSPHGRAARARPWTWTWTRIVIAGLAIFVVFLASCATVGRDFASEKVNQIQIGKTTQAEIEAMFGKPWRTGIEDGLVTWTYGKYKYSAFSQTQTKDLVVRFDNSKIVRSYTYNTTADKK